MNQENKLSENFQSLRLLDFMYNEMTPISKAESEDELKFIFPNNEDNPVIVSRAQYSKVEQVFLNIILSKELRPGLSHARFINLIHNALPPTPGIKSTPIDPRWDTAQYLTERNKDECGCINCRPENYSNPYPGMDKSEMISMLREALGMSTEMPLDLQDLFVHSKLEIARIMTDWVRDSNWHTPSGWNRIKHELSYNVIMLGRIQKIEDFSEMLSRYEIDMMVKEEWKTLPEGMTLKNIAHTMFSTLTQVPKAITSDITDLGLSNRLAIETENYDRQFHDFLEYDKKVEKQKMDGILEAAQKAREI